MLPGKVAEIEHERLEVSKQTFGLSARIWKNAHLARFLKNEEIKPLGCAEDCILTKMRRPDSTRQALYQWHFGPDRGTAYTTRQELRQRHSSG
jgi:hypothetical protein